MLTLFLLQSGPASAAIYRCTTAAIAVFILCAGLMYICLYAPAHLMRSLKRGRATRGAPGCEPYSARAAARTRKAEGPPRRCHRQSWRAAASAVSGTPHASTIFETFLRRRVKDQERTKLACRITHLRLPGLFTSLQASSLESSRSIALNGLVVQDELLALAGDVAEAVVLPKLDLGNNIPGTAGLEPL